MPKPTGQELNKKWGVGAAHSLYREDGTWYHTLNRFPGALFDKTGYILFSTQEEYENHPDLRKSKKGDKNWLSPKKPISNIEGYKYFETPQMFSNHSELTADANGDSDRWEGAKIQVFVNRYERDTTARKECIKIFGATCSVCKFNFEARYGEIGRDHIHVHHLKPISTRNTKYRVNPREDLRPVCPNCHEMLHTKDPPFTIEELIEMCERISVKFGSKSGSR